MLSRSTLSISINPIVLYIVVFVTFPTDHYCLVRMNTFVYICTTFTAHLLGRIDPKVLAVPVLFFPLYGPKKPKITLLRILQLSKSTELFIVSLSFHCKIIYLSIFQLRYPSWPSLLSVNKH